MASVDSKTGLARVVLIAAVSLVANPAAAQSIPEGQSCGGLFCDMGIFGHKTAPPLDAAAAPTVRRVEAVPAPVAAPAALPEPRKRIVRKAKRITKAVPTQERAAPAPQRAAASKPIAAANPIPVSATAKPTASGTNAILDPFSQPKPAFAFRPLY